jgi:lipopolysaccharide export system permease protein
VFTLWRYILKEHIGPFIFANCVIILVFLLNLVFRELGRILSRGLAFSLIMEFFFLNMAWIIALAVPMAVLISSLMAFGRLSGDNEIVAMKAGGVSILNIIFPVFIVSIFLAIFLIWFNNHVLPDFNHRARLLASDIARKRPTISLEPGVIYRDLPGYNLLVQKIKERPDTSYATSVFIEDNSDPNKSKIIFAESGKIFVNHSAGLLIMILYDGEMHELELERMEQYRKLYFPKQVISISVPDIVLNRSESEYRGDREKSAQTMLGEVRNNEKTIAERKAQIRKIIAAHFNRYLPVMESHQTAEEAPTSGKPITEKVLPGPENPARLTLQSIAQAHQQLRQQLEGESNVTANLERANYVLLVEIHKKYSIPVACIVFVLVGAPLGIMARRGGLAVAGGISFGFFLLYWASLIGGEELADNQFISPFMAMWLANILVGIGGIYLVFHSIHEATFINWTAISSFFARRKNR